MVRFAFLFGLAALSALGVDANSRGIGVPCNVNVNVGSNDLQEDASQPMWWAKKATWAGNKYTLRSGDGAAASDRTSYTPGAWTEIYNLKSP